MKPWIWLRIGAVLQAIGTVLHTIATLDSPSRGPTELAVFGAMQGFRFDIMGVTRSHWDFYRGYEVMITVIFALIAVLIWQLSTMSRTAPREARPLIVTLLVGEISLSIVSWTYFFAGPGLMSLLISLCLMLAILSLRQVDHEVVAGGRVASTAS